MSVIHSGGRKIGNEFKKYVGRVSNGRRTIKAPARSNVVRWMVETVASAADADTAPEVMPDTSNAVGNCGRCGQNLIVTPTGDGWFNRECESCGMLPQVKAA